MARVASSYLLSLAWPVAGVIIFALAALIVVSIPAHPRRKNLPVVIFIGGAIAAFGCVVVGGFAMVITTQVSDAALRDQIADTYGIHVEVSDLDYPHFTPGADPKIYGTTAVQLDDEIVDVTLVWDGERILLRADGVELERVEE